MCIRDSQHRRATHPPREGRGWLSPGERGQAAHRREGRFRACLLYTSDAADERSSVDLGGRRIIKKKKSTGRGAERV